MLDWIDLYNLAFVPVVAASRLADDLGVLSLPSGVSEAFASLSGVLQVTLALSMLSLVALFRVLGPLLITVVQMVADSTRFAVVLAIVVVGYANGFYSLIHGGQSAASLAQLPYDYSYSSIVTELGLWLTGQASRDIITALDPGVQLGANLLFWSFIATSYFVLLNLLIAIFNTTYERILNNSFAEWLFIRLRTTIEFEADPELPGVRAYYEQLQARDNQRAVRGGDAAAELVEDDETIIRSRSKRKADASSPAG